MRNALKINVATNFQVEKSTAEMCLKLVEIYVNSTGNKIIAKTNADGTETYEFENLELETQKQQKIGGKIK